MSKNKKKTISIAVVYSEWRKEIGGRAITPDEAAAAAGRLKQFGLEGNRLINDKLKSAPVEDLRLILALARHFNVQEIEEGLLEVITKRSLPLALKLECFELMTDLGVSLESDLLHQLQEAEEIYQQLSAHLGRQDDKGRELSLSLAEDLMKLPSGLKLSLLSQLKEEWGERAIPLAAAITGRDPEVDALALEIISAGESPEAVEALDKIAQGDAKDAARQARKALYKLRQRGLIAAEEEEQRAEPAAGEQGEQAFASNIDTFGSRLLLLAISGMREILVCQGSVDEDRGLLRFSAAEMHRKAWREFLKDLRGQIEADRYSSLVEIDPNHCRWLFEQAYKRAQKKGTLIPERFKGLRYRLKAPESYIQSAFLQKHVQVSDDQVRSVTAKLGDVFAIPEVAIWMVDREALLPYSRRYVEMAESKLVLNEQQRQSRLEGALSDFAAEYFSEESGRLELMVGRLEETAYLLAAQDRIDEARLTAALARDVAGSSFLQPHQFLRHFMLRSIIGTLHALQEEDKARRGDSSGNLIVKPGEER
jgi:hypothetical protein